MSDALQKVREDTELTAEDYRVFVTENLQESLDAVKISSDSVGSVYELLAENGIEAEKAIYALNDTLNDQQHALQMQDIENLSSKYEELRGQVDDVVEAREELEDYDDLVFHLDDEEIETAYNDLQLLYDLARDMENQSFSLSIDMGADLLDQANSIIDIMDDIVDATGTVGDEFVVAADKVDELALAFPGILEGYSITADGMVQLNAEVVQSIMGLHSADAQSMAEAQRSKLNNYADYLEQMAESYDTQSQMLKEEAEKHVHTEQEANDLIAKANQTLTETSMSLLEERGLAQDKVAQALVQSDDEANKTMAENIASGTDSASKNLNQLAQNGRTSFRIMAQVAYQVAQAVKAAGAANTDAAAQAVQALEGAIENTQSIFSGYSGSGTVINVVRNMISQALAAAKQRAQEIIQSQQNGKQTLLDEAESEAAKAEALRNLATRLRAGAVQIEAKSVETPATLEKVGIPEEKEETEKEKQKTLKDYIENPETVTGSNIDMKEYLDDEADRYERINTILEKLANQFTRIANEQDRVTGHDYAKNLGEQIALLKTQIQAQEKKLALQKEEAEQLKTNLAGQGVAFDSAGFALNNTEVFNSLQSKYNSAVDAYNEAQIQAQNDYLTEINRVKQENNQKINSLIDQYNSTAAGSEEESALKSEIDRAQKAATSSEKAIENAYKNLQSSNKEYYENLLKNSKEALDQYQEDIQRYDQLVSEEIEQSETAIEEFYNKIEDLQIEAYKKTVSMISNLKDMRETVLDINTLFSKLVSGDRPLDRMNNAVAKLSNYWDAGTESMLEYYSKEANEAAKRAQDMSLTQSERDYYARRVGDIESIMDSIRTGDSMETGNKG